MRRLDLNKAFEATVAASMPRIPLAIPGTTLWRGIRARKYMCEYFQRLLPAKRTGVMGRTCFRYCVRRRTKRGDQYTDEEVIDHMNFLMMAAHDTTTSTY